METVTHYHKDTPAEVRAILESALHTARRLRVFYGDGKTGKDWGEESFVTGTIGRSTGTKPIPLMLANCRSIGGPGLLDHCIVKIMEGGRVLWQHKSYNQPSYGIGRQAFKGYKVGVYSDGENVANFKSLQAAWRWIAFITGKRMSR